MHQTIPVTYIISGTPTQIPTKLSYKWNNEYDYMYDVNLVVTIEGVTYDLNDYIRELQKVLPPHIKIACCYSCRHGNFMPASGLDHEIFCLKDKVFNNKIDVCELLVIENECCSRKRKLLDYCDDYQPIDHDNYYTYNDWGLS